MPLARVLEVSYYLWRSLFCCMEVSDAKRLKAVEAENVRLKKFLAESALEAEITRDRCEKSCERSTGQTGGGAVDEGQGIVQASLSGNLAHECQRSAI